MAALNVVGTAVDVNVHLDTPAPRKEPAEPHLYLERPGS
jgi:hypothetical protein